MRVQDIMSLRVETVSPETSAEEAWERMKLHKVHHLVVAYRGSVVGVLSERDLGSRRGAILRKGKTVSELMTPQVVSAHRTMTVRQAANLLRGRTLGCLPVIESGRLLGIVTVSDLLELMGRGLERPVSKTTRYTLKHRGPRREPLRRF